MLSASLNKTFLSLSLSANRYNDDGDDDDDDDGGDIGTGDDYRNHMVCGNDKSCGDDGDGDDDNDDVNYGDDDNDKDDCWCGDDNIGGDDDGFIHILKYIVKLFKMN